ncbi:hypothetical protein GCM10010080_10390 [Thermomonas carbonis]|nr:hypothetical protein GCM10010080_10390 [Thermomonas carbonis]
MDASSTPAVDALSVPARATRALHSRAMDKNPKPDEFTLYGPQSAMRGRDSRTPEERSAAESKEWARRRGKGRRDWWKEKDPES